MTTVINPSGSPVPIFNRSGLTITDLNGAGEGNEPELWPEIQVVSEYTVIRFNNGAEDYGVKVPAGVEIGSLIEIYALNVANTRVNLPDGEEFINGIDNFTDFGRGCYRLRKISATQWFCERFVL